MKITEIIPSDLPKWMILDMQEGQLFNRMVERYETAIAEVDKLKTENNIDEYMGALVDAIISGDFGGIKNMR